MVCAAGYQIGVYYFPGWENNRPGMPAPLPWETIKGFPERQPLLGWYDDSSDAVVQKQIDWMAHAKDSATR